MVNVKAGGPVLAAVTAFGLLSTGCGQNNDSANNMEHTIAPTPTANVKRGAATGDSDVDVRVKLYYRVGATRPSHLTVPVRHGDRVEVVISSDHPEPISVTGHPEAADNVDAEEPEDVDFTVRAERTEVKIDKETVATFLVHSPG